MTDKPGFAASYSDFRLVKTRKVVQIVMEIPVEAANDVLAILGGMPNGGEERWFAIVPLVEQPKAKAGSEKKPPHRLVQRAGILCGDSLFKAFLKEQGHADEPKQFIYSYCNIASRRELATDQKAQVAFEDLLGKFEAWKKL